MFIFKKAKPRCSFLLKLLMALTPANTAGRSGLWCLGSLAPRAPLSWPSSAKPKARGQGRWSVASFQPKHEDVCSTEASYLLSKNHTLK